eukprot:s1427_g14.t1
MFFFAALAVFTAILAVVLLKSISKLGSLVQWCFGLDVPQGPGKLPTNDLMRENLTLKLQLLEKQKALQRLSPHGLAVSEQPPTEAKEVAESVEAVFAQLARMDLFKSADGPGRKPRSAETWLHLALSKLQNAAHSFLGGAASLADTGVAALIFCTCFLQEQQFRAHVFGEGQSNRSLTVTFGFDETQQRITRAKRKAGTDGQLGRTGLTAVNSGLTLRQTGRSEVASFLVQTGAVSWTDAGGGPVHKEEVIFPPLQLARTNARYLLKALLCNFQFVSPLEEILLETQQFPIVQWLVVADAASANCKMLPHLFSYLQQQASNALSVYIPCLLHQMSRVLVQNLERQGVSSPSVWISSCPLYCLSRLLQQSTLRSAAQRAMLVELENRFSYHRVFAVPARATNSSRFRSCLAQLLWTPWDCSRLAQASNGDGGAHALQTERMVNLQLAFAFFNGNLADGSKFEHWCTGCCESEEASLEKARRALN